MRLACDYGTEPFESAAFTEHRALEPSVTQLVRVTLGA
eukprot:COSAG05_NODE_13740_length_419_cov_1.131250_1_plen_37_part_10